MEKPMYIVKWAAGGRAVPPDVWEDLRPLSTLYECKG